MNNTKKLKEMQAERMKKYPPDRICFYSSDSSAAMDQTTFIAYEAGLAAMIEREVNYLDESRNGGRRWKE